jgi:hypothetical protein
MATQKTLPTAVTADSFLNSVADETVRADCKEIVAMMTSITKEQPIMWGTAIIGFGKYHYKYASGHEGDSCIIGFSPRKQNITLYVSAKLKALEPYLEKLGKHKVSGGCLHIKKLDHVDRTVLKELIKTSYKELKTKNASN